MFNMLRSRETRLYFLVLATLGVSGCGICFSISAAAGTVAALVYVAMLLVTYLFQGWRYRRISELSDCLARIAAGDYTMEMNEYRDGELSILRGELYKVTRTLSHQAESLARDKRFLADSLSDISHQLKTPLTGISMMSELLSDADLPQEKRDEFVAGIETGLSRIRSLVAALLKLSRLDAGAVEFRREPVELGALLEQVVGPLRIPIELAGQTFTTAGADGLTLQGDSLWLAEALSNLVKNCVEHTPAGGHIAVNCAGNPLYTLIEVRDDGPGIGTEDLPHVFERFYRGRNAAADSAGIGLALSRSIIQQQGGTITAASEPGAGTVFTIKLYGSPA